MKTEMQKDLVTPTPFTLATLNILKEKGFRYVQVKGITSDRRLDYMAPSYWVLIPLKDLPDAVGKTEIFEPINSPVLLEWANRSNDGNDVLVIFRKND